MPANVDWVSSDHYRTKSSDDYLHDVKEMYAPIFSKMHGHQRAVLIPGAGHPKDHHKMCDDQCTAKVELQDAKDFVDWAKSDSRIVGVMPYSWMRDGQVEQGANQLSGNGDLLKFYADLGRSTK